LCEVNKEHSFARGFTLRLVGTFANDDDTLRIAAGSLRRTHWFVAVLIKLIAETYGALISAPELPCKTANGAAQLSDKTNAISFFLRAQRESAAERRI
jgi:hypothetical protein